MELANPTPPPAKLESTLQQLRKALEIKKFQEVEDTARSTLLTYPGHRDLLYLEP